MYIYKLQSNIIDYSTVEIERHSAHNEYLILLKVLL